MFCMQIFISHWKLSDFCKMKRTICWLLYTFDWQPHIGRIVPMVAIYSILILMKRFQAYYLYEETWSGEFVSNILRNNKNRRKGEGNYMIYRSDPALSDLLIVCNNKNQLCQVSLKMLKTRTLHLHFSIYAHKTSSKSDYYNIYGRHRNIQLKWRFLWW